MNRQQTRPVLLRYALSMACLITCVLLSGITHWGQTAYAQHPLLISIHDYPVPQGSSYPWGTTLGGTGKVWVALPGCDPTPMCNQGTPPGQIGIFNQKTLSFVADLQLPAGYTQALFLAFDQHGKLWFPMPMSNAIAMYDPKMKSYHMWTVPTAASGPWDIAIDSHGDIWFTEHFSNKIGRFDPQSQQFLEITTPAANSQPYGITVDDTGNVWFTENNPAVALIGEYTTRGTLLEYKIRNSFDGNLTPHLITSDRKGNVWWTEGFVGMIAKLKVADAQPGTNKEVSEYAYTHQSSVHASGIGIDLNGNVWFDDSLLNIFGSFPVSGKGNFSLYAAPGDHPHDGLMVDHSNRIWFDEEFSNTLALAIQ